MNKIINAILRFLGLGNVEEQKISVVTRFSHLGYSTDKLTKIVEFVENIIGEFNPDEFPICDEAISQYAKDNWYPEELYEFPDKVI